MRINFMRDSKRPLTTFSAWAPFALAFVLGWMVESRLGIIRALF